MKNFSTAMSLPIRVLSFYLFLLCFCLNGFSNPLPTLSTQKVWYKFETIMTGPEIYYSRHRISEEQFVVQGQLFHRVDISRDSIGDQWESTQTYVREDNGRLYVLDSLNQQKEILIMDINLQLGDPFIAQNGSFGEIPLMVTRVDTIMDLLGQPRRVLELTCDGEAFPSHRWIEGIGPDRGVFSDYHEHCVIDGIESWLTCMYEDGLQVFQNEAYDFCWRPNPPIFPVMKPIVTSALTRYVVLNNPSFPFQKMQRWRFNVQPQLLTPFHAYFELMGSDMPSGTNFVGTGNFFREKDNKVYKFISQFEGERLIYDMNLNLGDRIEIDYTDGPQKLVAIAVDTIQLLDGVDRKRITLQCEIDGQLEEGDPTIWIEGIGDIREPLVDYAPCSLWDGQRPELYCVEDQTQRIYRSTESPENCWIDDFYTSETLPDAIWYSSSYKGDFASGDCQKKIDITRVVRDTVIDYRTCRILGVTTDGIYLPESELITFEVGGRFYFYEDGVWRLLYDYNAQVGDTITYYISKKYHYYTAPMVPAPYDESLVTGNPFQIRIVAIDSVYTPDGIALKRYRTENLNLGSGHVMGEIIERVGSTQKLFGQNIDISLPECRDSEPIGLRCFSEGEISLKFTDRQCDQLTSIGAVSAISVVVYPNPGHEKMILQLNSDVALPMKVTITDVLGRQVHHASFDQERVEIPTHTYLSGLYLITIQDQSGRVWHGKWVKG